MPKKRFKKNKNNIKSILSSRTFLLFSLALAVFLSVSVGKELLRKIEVSREISSLQQEIEQMESENQQLADLVDYINSSRFQEKEIKKRFNLKEEGESVIFIPENNKNNNYHDILSQQRENIIAENNLANYQKWWNYFFNS